MTRRSICRFSATAVVGVGLLVLASGCSRKETGARTLSIGVIPKGTTHEFWKSIHAGAVKASRELSSGDLMVNIIWKGPMREDDREQQVQVVEGFLSQGVDGIVLAPLDDRALVRPVLEAKRAGIPTVIFDSDLASEEIVSFVATDNYKGGQLAADRLGQLLKDGGKVLLLRYQEGSASTTARENGFLERIRSSFPKIQVISSDQYSGPTRDTAKRASENLLNRYAAELSGIFCVNESSTAGMLLALQDIGKAGQITFVGFDSSEPFVRAMGQGQLQGFVVQNPLNMGYLAVKTMVDHLQGRRVDKRVDTGVWLITPENVNAADAQQLLHPPIDQYLD